MPDGIGEVLRQQRLAREIELAEVEERTKIRVRYLRALEAEDWEALPDEAYVRGFLRSYADFLGLDGLALVEEYRRLTPPPEPEHPAQPAPRSARRGFSVDGLSLSGGWVAAIAAAGLVGILFVIGLLGGGGSGNGPTPERAGHRSGARPGNTATTTTTSTPSLVTVRLTPTADVWVCLVDQRGKPLIDGEILTAGDHRGPFSGREMKLGLGNGAVRIEVDGRTVPVPASPNPLGYELTPNGVRKLAGAARPSCT